MYDEELTVAPVPDADGRISAYVAIIRDISQRLQTEQDRLRLAEAIEHASDSIEILDRQGQIVYVNPAYERRTGHRLGEVRGSRPEALLDFSADDAAYAEMRRTIAAGQPWTGILRSRDLDDRPLEEDVTVTPMRDSHGEIYSYVVVKRDVTEKRAMEAQLQRAQKLQSIGQLAGGIAHELNSPAQYLSDNYRFLHEAFAGIQALLARLSGLARGGAAVPAAAIAAELARIDADDLAEEVPKALLQSADGLQKIAGIARGMRDLAYSGADKTPVDLNRAIQSTIAVAANEWKYVADVRAELDEALPPVRCAPGDFNLVILNLLVNAAQAIAAGSGDGKRGKGTITVSTTTVGDWVEIRVSDTGTGIAPEIRQAIFDPSHHAGQAGRGQGLALAQDVIVIGHGGTIGVESEPGAGSTFIIRLPVGDAPASAAAA
jgi:PAS domain S-box-containing protein